MTLDNVRQPKPVRVIVIGEREDVDAYTTMIRRFIEGRGHDNTLLQGLADETLVQFTIYPGAVNE